jgi:flagellar FliL protein
MSTTADAVPAPDAAPVKGRSRRLLAIIAAVLVLGIAAGGYLFLSGGAADADPAPEPAPEDVAEGPVVEVGTLTTNLAGTPARYARVGLAVVLTAEADPAAVEARFPLVKDAAITEIGRHDAAMLQTADGSGALRDGLTEAVVSLYPDGEVVRVVLTELLIQ